MIHMNPKAHPSALQGSSTTANESPVDGGPPFDTFILAFGAGEGAVTPFFVV